MLEDGLLYRVSKDPVTRKKSLLCLKFLGEDALHGCPEMMQVTNVTYHSRNQVQTRVKQSHCLYSQQIVKSQIIREYTNQLVSNYNGESEGSQTR